MVTARRVAIANVRKSPPALAAVLANFRGVLARGATQCRPSIALDYHDPIKEGVRHQNFEEAHATLTQVVTRDTCPSWGDVPKWG